MDTPVFKIYMAKRTLALSQLPQERVQALIEKVGKALADSGGQTLIDGTLFSTERYHWFGVERYPNWQALREHERCLDELDWFQYLQSETFLGVEHPSFPIDLTPRELDPSVEYIAQIYFQRYLPAMYDWNAEELADVKAAYESGPKMGIIGLVDAYAQPVSGEWHWWGVSLFSSMDLLVQHARHFQDHKWWKYYYSHTHLASPESGLLIGK